MAIRWGRAVGWGLGGVLAIGLVNDYVLSPPDDEPPPAEEEDTSFVWTMNDSDRLGDCIYRVMGDRRSEARVAQAAEVCLDDLRPDVAEIHPSLVECAVVAYGWNRDANYAFATDECMDQYRTGP